MTDETTPPPTTPLKPRIRILYNDGPPGCGKSRYLRRRVVTEPGRYLYAAPITANLDEAAKDIRAMAKEAGMDRQLTVIEIHSGNKAMGGKRISREIERQAKEVVPTHHLVVLCTHEGLMAADLSGFVGWKLFIDEVPVVTNGGTMRTPASVPLFEQNYLIDPVDGTDWAVVKPRADAAGPRLLGGDDLLKPLVPFHRRAAQRGVNVDIQRWSDMETRAWSWWSLWSIDEAASFDEVVLVGNAFDSSITKKAIEMWTASDSESDVVFERFDLPARALRVSRKVVVHWFTDDPGTTTFWGKHADGKRCIDAVADWLKANAPDDLLWSANEDAAERIAARGVSGTRVQPILTGLNAFRDRHWAALIYSAKMTPDEHNALRLFELDAAEVRRSREFETIVQFAFRTSLREDGSAETVHMVVYDRAQAEFLKSFLERHALASVALSKEDINIDGLRSSIKTPAGRANDEQSEDAVLRRRLKGRERQERLRARRRAEAPPKPPGRPRISRPPK